MYVKILCNERSRIDFWDFSVMMKTEEICHKKRRTTMRILIAEDEVEIARALKVLLEKNKCVADIVHNGKDAWDFVSQENYDVIVLDIIRPLQPVWM